MDMINTELENKFTIYMICLLKPDTPCPEKQNGVSKNQSAWVLSLAQTEL